MAYTSGSAATWGAVMSALDTFMTGTPGSTVLGGFTQDDYDDGATTASEGYAAWHKDSLYVGVKWIANDPQYMSIHQATGYTAGQYPGDHTGDSGNGYNDTVGSGTVFGVNGSTGSSSLGSFRCINGIDETSPFNYYFFGDDTAETYVHVVVEVATDTYRHFGWGNMDKFHDWTGGEYCYGHFQEEATNTTEGTDTGCQISFDGLSTTNVTSLQRRYATMRVTGFGHQDVGEVYMQMGGSRTSDEGTHDTDTAGNYKRLMFGGFRGGPIAYLLGPYRADVATGHIPMYPFTVFARDYTTGDEKFYLMGKIPDTRGIDIYNFSPAQEVTIGSDTWQIFPASRRTEDAVEGRTYYQGIAYKKIT